MNELTAETALELFLPRTRYIYPLSVIMVNETYS